MVKDDARWMFNTLFPLKIGGLATVSANNLKSLDVIFDSDSDQINDSDEMKKCQVTIEVQEEEVTKALYSTWTKTPVLVPTVQL